MVIRLHNVEKWEVWEPGKALQLPSDDAGARLVRINVNCPVKTAFSLESGGVLTFIGNVEGMETLEFNVAGTVEVMATTLDEVSPVYYYTDDGRDVTVEFPESESFLRIMSRKERNLNQEWAEFMVLQGERRRNADLAEAKQRMSDQLAELRAEFEAKQPKEAKPDGNVDGSAAPKPTDDQSAAKAAGGGDAKAKPPAEAAKGQKPDGAA